MNLLVYEQIQRGFSHARLLSAPAEISTRPLGSPGNTVWLVSYPRSGNTYLRTLIWHCFGLRTGSVYPNDLRDASDTAHRVGGYGGASEGLFSAEFRKLPLIKTHEWPTDDHKAIYVVRNGRDSCRSLWRFLRATGYDVDLDDIIAGRHHFGSWSGHYLAWNPAARPNTLFLRFEAMTSDFAGTLDRLAEFLDRRPVDATPPPPVSEAGRGPRWLSPGTSIRTALTAAQDALFDQFHGPTMELLGYPRKPVEAAPPPAAPVILAAPVPATIGSTTAIVWRCWGATYLAEARESARSTLSLGIDRVLIVDHETEHLAKGDPLFTRVIAAEPKHRNNLEKSRIFELVPAQYQTVLCLDCDTRVVGDISAGFAAARRHGIAVVPAPHYDLGSFFDFDVFMREHGVEPAGQMQYNAGMIFYHLTDPVCAVLCRWRDLCWAARDVYSNDQPFLSLAFELLGFRPYVLSPQYNYRGLGELAVGPIRIWHSHDPVPPDLNTDEPAWPPRRFRDGARVAW